MASSMKSSAGEGKPKRARAPAKGTKCAGPSMAAAPIKSAIVWGMGRDCMAGTLAGRCLKTRDGLDVSTITNRPDDRFTPAPVQRLSGRYQAVRLGPFRIEEMGRTLEEKALWARGKAAGLWDRVNALDAITGGDWESRARRRRAASRLIQEAAHYERMATRFEGRSSEGGAF